MKTIFYQWKKRLFQKSKKNNQGFTLIELLVTVMIAGVIITPLLALMFGLLDDNRKEMALTETQQEMKRALSYITSELKGAVFVYNGTQLNTLVTDNYLPNFGADTNPILAFWKIETLPSDQLPDNCTSTKVDPVNDLPNVVNSDTDKAVCNNLRIERRSYTLVVYLQSIDNSNDTWQGNSRILRYQLPKFSDIQNNLDPTPDVLTRTVGYVDPRSESTFENWPKNLEKVSLQSARPADTAVALVDFVDDPIADRPRVTVPDCPSPEYGRSPLDDNNFKSFFVCVKTPEQSNNQETFLYLRGSSEGKYGLGDSAFFPILQTQVISRGVLDKSVD